MGELTLNLTNAQWFGAVALVMVAVARPPVSRCEVMGDALTVGVFGLTGPFALLLLPLFAARVWRDRDRSSWWLLALIGLAACAQVIGYVNQPAPAEPKDVPPVALIPVLAAAGMRTGGEFVGATLIGSETTVAIVGLIALAGWAATWVLIPARVMPRGVKLALACIAGAVLAGGLLRYRAYPVELFLPTHAQRYFHLPLLATVWLLAGGATHLANWRRALCLTLLALFAVQMIAKFRLPALVDFHWSDHTAAISRGEAVNAPINPAPWAVVLKGTSAPITK